MDIIEFKNLSVDDAWEEASKMADMEASILNGVWTVESNRGTNMVSPAGAVGHFQIMPRERRVMSKRIGKEMNPYDFHESLYVAALMLKENKGRFKNTRDALSAYNGGWTPSKWSNPETAAYANKVMKAANKPLYDMPPTRIEGQPPPRVLEEGGAGAGDGYMQHNTQKGDTGGLFKTQRVELQKTDDVYDNEFSTVTPNEIIGAKTGAGSDYQDNFYPRYTAANATNEEIGDIFASINSLYTIPASSNVDPTEREDARLLEDKQQHNELYADIGTFKDRFAVGYAGAFAYTAIANFKAGEQNLPTHLGINWDLNKEFDYAEYAPNLELGLDEDTRGFLRKSKSFRDLGKRWEDVQRRGINAQAFINASTMGTIVPSLLGGLGDPVYAATGGVGRLAGGVMLARGTNMLKSTAVAMAVTGSESILLDTFLKLQGNHVTNVQMAENFMMTAAFAGAWHTGAWGLTTGKKATQVATSAYFDKKALADLKLYNKARENIGGVDADAAAVVAEMDRMAFEQVQKAADILTAPAPDVAVVFKDSIDITPEAQQLWKAKAAKLSIPEDYFKGDDLRFAVEAHEWAEKVNDVYNLDTSHNKAAILKHFRGAHDNAKSASFLLAQEKNPIAKALGFALAETPISTGERIVTASVSKEMFRMSITQDIHVRINEFSDLFAAENNISKMAFFLDKLGSEKHRTAFNTAVTKAAHYRVKHGEYAIGTAESVKGAVDALSKSYGRASVMGRKGKIAGWELLPEKPLVGWLPRKLLGEAVNELTPVQYNAVVVEVNAQLRANNFSKEVAKDVSSNYFKRAKDTFNNLGNTMGLNALSKGGKQELIESLRANGVSEGAIRDIMRLDHPSASGHFRSRLDLDFDKVIKTAEGDFDMSTLLDTDLIGQHMQYTNRMSGELGLARFGIKGEEQLDAIISAMTVGDTPASKRGIEAAQQIKAEMLGLKYGTHSAILSTTSNLAASSMFGMLTFTQVVDSMNIATQLGHESFMNAIRTTPKILRDISSLKKGVAVTDGALSGIESSTGVVLGMGSYYDDSMFNFKSRTATTPNAETMNVVNKAARVMGDVQSITTGHKAVVSAQTRIAASEVALKAVRYAEDGGMDATMLDFGFTPEVIASLKKNLPNMMTKGIDGNIKVFDITQWDDAKMANAFVGSVLRGSYNIIQNTFVGEKGKWVHNSVLKFMGQLRGYSIVSLEKQLGRQLKNDGMLKVAAKFGVISMWATLVYYARANVAALGLKEEDRKDFLEKRLSIQNIVNGILNSNSLAGLTSDIVNLGVWAGKQGEDGGMATRGGGESLISSTIAPAVGTINNMVDGVKSGKPKQFMSNLPLGRTWYATYLRNIMFPPE